MTTTKPAEVSKPVDYRKEAVKIYQYVDMRLPEIVIEKNPPKPCGKKAKRGRP